MNSGGVSEDTKQTQQRDAFIRLSNSPSEGEVGEDGPGSRAATPCDISTLLLHSEVKLVPTVFLLSRLKSWRINLILKGSDLDI